MTKYSSKFEEDFYDEWEVIQKKGLYAYVRQAAIDFGREDNCNRQINFLYDGMKPSLRRTLYVAMGFGDKLTKTAKISGAVIGSLHPHGDASINPIISAFVRLGVFNGRGNHGESKVLGNDISPAAPRYTEAKLDPKYRELIAPLIDYVPFKDGELDEKEPEYIPVPIPLCLSYGGTSIAYGIASKVPAFSVRSLYNAMINDNPELLEAAFGLELDRDRTDFQNLWKYGKGKVGYKFRIEDIVENGNVVGVALCGKAELFKPIITKISDDEEAPSKGKKSKSPLSRLIDYAYDEFITMTEDLKVNRVEFRLVKKRSNPVTIDILRELVEKCRSYARVYTLWATDGKTVFRVSLKKWLEESYTNYLNLIRTYRSTNISKYEFDYQVYSWLPKVAELIFDNRSKKITMTPEEIDSTLGIGNVDIVKAIRSKTISKLDHSDTSVELDRISKKLEEFRNLDEYKFTEDIINKF